MLKEWAEKIVQTHYTKMTQYLKQLPGVKSMPLQDLVAILKCK